MAKNNVSIKFGADSKQAESVIGKLTSTLNKFKKQLDPIAKMGASISGLESAFNLVSKGVSAVAATVRDLAETYKTQERAEIQLETAARNNPYLNASSVVELKKYAAELQNISGIGDERLLPMMAQLAAAGRTQNEIQQIMSAAVDASASGVVSLESAVQGLNASYNGSVGALGRCIPQLKNLTSEQLRSGEAVKVVAENYKGMAESVLKSVGSTERLNNAWGDFKELVGEGINGVLAPVENAIADIITEINDAWSHSDRIAQAAEARARDAGIDTGDNIKSRAAQAEQERKEEERRQKEFAEATEAYYKTLGLEAQAHAEQRLKIWAEENKLTEKEMLELQQKVLSAYGEYFGSVKLRAVVSEDSLKIFEKDVKEYVQSKLGLDKNIANDFFITLNYKLGDVDSRALAEELRIRESVAAEAKKQEALDAKISANSEDYNSRLSKILEAERKTLENAEREAFIKGETVSTQAKLNAATTAYLKLAADPKLSVASAEYKKKVDSLAAQAKAEEELKKIESELKKITEDNIKKVNELLNPTNKKATLSDAIQATIDQLEEQQKKFKEGTAAFKKYKDKIDELNSLKPKVQLAEFDGATKEISSRGKDGKSENIEKLKNEKLELEKKYSAASVLLSAEEVEKRKELYKEYAAATKQLDKEIAAARFEEFSNMMQDITSVAERTADVMSSACDLMLQSVNAESELELATLEKKYLQGEISEEEYEKKKVEAKRKAANEEYKIQMFQWGANLLQATANIALGVTQALGQNGPMGIITGALVAAAGAVQIASIIASKPTKPSFAKGGFVPGRSYSGDRVPIMANSGEAVLNAAQQRNFMNLANGKGGGAGTNIVINNSASNIVRAQPQVDKDRIVLMIDARVNDSLRNGRYDQSLTMANQGMGGDFYGI